MGASSFVDEFQALDSTRWRRGMHGLGRGRVEPGNVTAADGQLVIRTVAAGHSGGEVCTRTAFGDVSVVMVARCAVSPGALCALSMTQATARDTADSLDLEILPGTHEVMLTTCVAGRRTNHARRRLDFDPAADFHAYAIRRADADVRFLVDQDLVAWFRHDLPRSRMPVRLGAWWPTWLSGTGDDGRFEVARVAVDGGAG